MLATQKPIVTLAKNSIAGFKVREKMELGITITLRGEKMYSFLDRLINLALPRIRDFQGLDPKKFDKNGNLELDFTWGGLLGAVVANVFASFKGLENSRLLHDPDLKARIGGAGNQFALMTIISLLTSIPLMIFREGDLIMKFWTAFNGGMQTLSTASLKGADLDKITKSNLLVGEYNKISKKIFENVILSGLTFYGYNEVSTMTLTKVSAVTNSVANTAKRVVVIVGCAIVFKEDFSGLKPYGCAICMLGVGLYSVIDDLLKPKKVESKKQ
jgi:solute carrier family 35 protein E1